MHRHLACIAHDERTREVLLQRLEAEDFEISKRFTTRSAPREVWVPRGEGSASTPLSAAVGEEGRPPEEFFFEKTAAAEEEEEEGDGFFEDMCLLDANEDDGM